jgi:hypothetical protein
MRPGTLVELEKADRMVVALARELAQLKGIPEDVYVKRKRGAT